MPIRMKTKLLNSTADLPRESGATQSPTKSERKSVEKNENPRASDDAAPATKGKAKWVDARGPPELDFIIRKPNISNFVGLRLSVIHDMIAKGTFPRPLLLNPNGRTVGWLSSEIAAWQRTRAAERDNAAGSAS
jgi:prophage regulatory protein